jgi:hypothetical protein
MILHHFKLCKMNKNKKIMKYKNRRGPKRMLKKEKKTFCKLESLFFFLLIFHYSFSFAFQIWLNDFFLIIMIILILLPSLN